MSQLVTAAAPLLTQPAQRGRDVPLKASPPFKGNIANRAPSAKRHAYEPRREAVADPRRARDMLTAEYPRETACWLRGLMSRWHVFNSQSRILGHGCRSPRKVPAPGALHEPNCNGM